EEFLKQMTESSPLAFLVVDNRTDEILYINHLFCEIWGIEPLEEPIRRKELKNHEIFPACLPQLKDPASFAAVNPLLQSENDRDVVDDEIPFADGRTIRRFSSQIRDREDVYYGRLFVFEDITARKDAEKLLQVQRDLTWKLSGISDMEEALILTLDAILQLSNLKQGGIYLFDDTEHNLNLVAYKGLPDSFLATHQQYGPSSRHVRFVKEGKPFYGPYQDGVFPVYDARNKDDIQSLAVVPILHEGKAIGALNIGARTAHKFFPSMQRSIESLVMEVGSTIARIRAEKALLSIQMNFKLLFDTLDDFMFVLDDKGYIIRTNTVVEKRLGYTAEQLHGMHVLEVHPPERRDEAGFIVGEMVAGRVSFCPVPLITRDGTEIPVETRVVKGKWDNQEVLFGVSRDVSERQKLDAALMMQSAAFESFALSIHITNLKDEIQWANPAFVRLTGFTLEEAVGKTLDELQQVSVEEAAFFGGIKTVLLQGKAWSGELINRRKDGSSYPEELTVSPVFDHKGNICNYISIKIDISDRKAMEVALRESEARWKFALEGSGDGVWDWNVTTGEMYISKMGKALLGYEEDLLPNYFSDWEVLMHPDDKEALYGSLERHLNGEEEILNAEFRMRCRNGVYKWVLVRGKAVAWMTHGMPSRVIGTLVDVSRRKEFEESLQSAIAREKELNDLKSRFVSMASHEFRTPLASIMVLSDSLRSYWKKMNQEQIYLKLNTVIEQVQHLSQVVGDVMQVSKIQEGRISFSPQQVDMLALTQKVVRDFNSDRSLKHKILFEHNLPELTMFLDMRLMNQVFNNLISNALKYSPPDPRICIKLYEKENEVVWEIQDNGMGIPEHEKDKLFSPFFRAENVRQIQGNGLGLNIVRESIRLHGGEVTFESTEHEGSTFFVHLPKALIRMSLEDFTREGTLW
ncbi:MAG: PAS domain S-box protein, partial [Marinilabiliales bacterium]|nr:PAS domain S-box protein [Marinilabiliales bacterium]